MQSDVGGRKVDGIEWNPHVFAEFWRDGLFTVVDELFENMVSLLKSELAVFFLFLGRYNE